MEANTKTSFSQAVILGMCWEEEYHLQNNQLPESPAGNSGNLNPEKSKEQQVDLQAKIS